MRKNTTSALPRPLSPCRDCGTQKRDAMDALARQFPPEKRIAVDVKILERRITGASAFAKPRLRFDRVALRLVRDVQAALRDLVPDGKTLIVTVSAPILLPSKTASALERELRPRLARKAARVDLAEVIHGNHVRARLLNVGSKRTANVIGFVHNPDSDVEALIDMTHALLECVGAEHSGGAPARARRDRWLLLVDDGPRSRAQTYRQIYSQLDAATGFGKVLVFCDGQIDDLSSPS